MKFYFQVVITAATILLSSTLFSRTKTVTINKLVELQSTSYIYLNSQKKAIEIQNQRIRESIKELFITTEEDIFIPEPPANSPLIYNKAIESPIFEDYSSDGRGLQKFFEAVTSSDKSLTRVGVMGDSFIEGDIFTMDLRKILQKEVGGRGVGFVPTTSVAAPYRPTVRHKFSGWNTKYLKREKSSLKKSDYIISSFYSTIGGGRGRVEYEFKEELDSLNTTVETNYIFRSKSTTSFNVKINDNPAKTVNISPSDNLQLYNISHNNEIIKKLTIEFNSAADIISYGISRESTQGVIVDNFSDRASSGIRFSLLSDQLSSDFDSLMGEYSLIVLQFGLNVMSSGTNNYTNYKNSMIKVVDKIKKVHPNASIIVMGVSERMIKKGGVYTLMSEAESMENYQREIAKETGVLFWSTRKAMIQEGGIKKFVENGLAAKDYTHINAKGGKVVAEKFVNSLAKELISY